MSASSASVAAHFDVVHYGDRRDERPDLLIELPHGATETPQYEELRDRLIGRFPADLKSFFHVNTDAGAPECADAIGRHLAREGYRVRILRCLVPRTFIDVNRRIDAKRSDGKVVAGLTPGLPAYVTETRDIELLLSRYRAYDAAARSAFEEVCGGGGLALILHTYAPRSVEIDRIDERIVARLREAYRPEDYERWPRRPAVDVISEDPAGSALAPAELVKELRRRYDAVGIAAEENATYRLDPGSTGYHHARRHPNRVLCVEFNRELLGAPWRPFEPFTASPEGVEALSRPLAETLIAALKRRGD